MRRRRVRGETVHADGGGGTPGTQRCRRWISVDFPAPDGPQITRALDLGDRRRPRGLRARQRRLVREERVGLDELVEPVTKFNEVIEKASDEHKAKRKKLHSNDSGMTEEEAIKAQQELFAKARARMEGSAGAP